ncbi:hypothetical protein HOY80DRAFT_1094826 [Tuber brumale]|nr:hypothetical protein HOY80DRAFT_1094826 [Tuber brumale]
MFHRQTPSRRSGSLQSLSDSNSGGESVITFSEGQPLRPFSSNDQPRRNHILLARKFSLTFFSLILLVICLRAFSQLRLLSKWEQRCFNTLSILLTAIASLGLGSLLGHLGSMLRWPLLARTVYKMQDVDSILGMSPPAGSLRLIESHIRERRISRTTLIVTAYLVTNVVGRLSVAIFGLAYNMTDKTGIEYPILATNWTSAAWASGVSPDETSNTKVDKYKSGESKDTTLRTRIGDDINQYLPSDLQMSNTTLKVGANQVKYSYNLKDFKEGYARPSNRTVHSAANCSLIEVGEGQYWRWGNGNRTGPFNWGLEGSVEVVPEILRISNTTRVDRPLESFWMSFQDLLNGSNVFPQIYVLCWNIAWECWPTLTETIGDNETHQILPHERFFHPTDLYRLATVGNGEYGDGNNEYYVSQHSFSSSSSGVEADDGAAFLCDNRLFDSPNETVWNGYGLWMAGLVARLPITAIMCANADLPQLALGPHPDQTSGTAYLHTTLEVDWLRVVLTAVGITVGQILTTLAVLYYCNGVYTRDDSNLATAELLKTVITKFDDGKLMTGEELASSLDGVLKVSVSYGTRKSRDGGAPEVDIASGLDANFPPFPSFPQKQQF